MDTSDVIKIAFPGYYLIEKVMKKNIETFGDSADKSTLQKLKEDALREEIKASVLQNQAKVEQELAIARRIDNAEEVEIEEYYDLSGSCGVGLTGTDNTVSFGLNGEGQKVTKRIFKFKGCSAITPDIKKIEPVN